MYMRFCILWLLVVVTMPLFAKASLLEDDPRLQSPVTLRAKMLPIPQILREVGRETGVPLECTKGISEDKMTVLVRDYPAWKLLQRLADVMGYSWERTKSGYRLAQSIRSAQEEAQALLEEQSALSQEVQQFIRAAMPEVGRDYPDIVEEYVQLSKEIDSLWKQSQDVPEEVSRRRNQLYHVAHPQQYLFARLCRRLSPQDWQRFWNGEVLLASTMRSDQWLPITENIRSWRQAREILYTYILSQPGRTRVLPEGKRVTLPEVSPSTQYLFAFYLDWQTGVIRTSLLHSEDGVRYAGDQMDVFWSEIGRKEARSGALWQRWSEWQTPEEARKDAPLCQKPLQPKEGTKESSNTPLPFVDSRKTMADYLEWLFDHAQVNIVADAFRYPLGGGQMRPDMEAKTVGEWMRGLQKQAAGAYLYGWWRVEEDALLFRHHRYWWLRQSEPPENLLKMLEERYEKRNITLSDYALLAKNMTPMHEGRLKRGLLVVQFDTTPFVDITQNNLPALRFWGNLSPVQQRNALAGKPLRVDTLPRAVQQLFWQAVGYGLVHASLDALPEPVSFSPQVHASGAQSSKYYFVGKGWSGEADSLEQFWNEHVPLTTAMTGTFTPPTSITKFRSMAYKIDFVFSPSSATRYFIRLRTPEEVGKDERR